MANRALVFLLAWLMVWLAGVLIMAAAAGLVWAVLRLLPC